MNPAPNLVLVGPMGAGKTTIGKRLARSMGLTFVDADQAIEKRTGASVATIFECEGEAGFRQRESTVLAELLRDTGRLLATGGGAILSEDNRRLLRERGFVVWLQTDVAHQLQRLARDRSRPLLQRPDREQVLEAMARQRAPLYAQVADFHFDTRGRSGLAAAAVLRRQLATRWQRGDGAAETMSP
ncbi:MAG: shikimate kinase [Pseudoxanthomonas suwonensis]|nr:shikimate kinase [Pseudoxanthomonas suwonensis]